MTIDKSMQCLSILILLSHLLSMKDRLTSVQTSLINLLNFTWGLEKPLMSLLELLVGTAGFLVVPPAVIELLLALRPVVVEAVVPKQGEIFYIYRK